MLFRSLSAIYDLSLFLIFLLTGRAGGLYDSVVDGSLRDLSAAELVGLKLTESRDSENFLARHVASSFWMPPG
jgi:hypothetical protein